MDEAVLTEASPEGGAVDTPEEQTEEAALASPAPSPPADLHQSQGEAPGPEGLPPPEPPGRGPDGPQEPPEDWLEPLEEDDFEEEEDDAQSWGQSGSREGSVSGSAAGRGRGGRRRRSRVLVEEDWDECPCLGEGWKRKEVFRRSGCYMGKSDTYYMSPTGVRVRSKVELAKCLSGSVDLDMFDFKSGQFLSAQQPRKRRRWAKESKQSDQSQEEEEQEEEQEQEQEQEQPLAEKERLPAKRKRAKNFSDVEKKHLRQLVLSFPAAQSRRRGHRSSSDTDKSKAWAEICQHFNEATETQRTLKQLQFLWQKMRLTGGLKVGQRHRAPRVRGSALAQLRRREGKRRRRRAQASAAVATTTPPATGSPAYQKLLPSVSPSSPLQAQPAPPSPDDSPAPSHAHSPAFLLHIKQESSDTLISNAYTLTDTLTHAHTLTDTHTHQAYHPTSAEVAPGNSPQRPPSNNSTGGGQTEDSQPSTLTESSGGGGSWSPPCGPSAAAWSGRGRGPRGGGGSEGRVSLSLGEELDLRFHRRRMRFLRQEHQLRMRVLQLELSLRQQERDLLLSRTASPANHTPAQPHAANGNASQPHRASDDTVHCQTANDKAANRQTTNHSTVFGETSKEATVHKKMANHSRVHRLSVNQTPGPAQLTSPNPRSPAQQLAKQKQTANALLALIAGGRKSQSRRRSQPASQSEAIQDPPSRPLGPITLKRHGNRQTGRRRVGSKSHAPSASKRRGRVAMA